VPRIDLRRKRRDVPDLRLFYPTWYEMQDCHKARESSPNITPFFVVVGTHYSKQLLNRTFGAGHWLTLLSRSDQPMLHRQIQGILQSVRGQPFMV
jgi:hypothetical protein